jgi:hypothetical protein
MLLILAQVIGCSRPVESSDSREPTQETLARAQVIDGTKFEAGTRVTYVDGQLTRAVLGQDQRILHEIFSPEDFPHTLKKGTVLEYSQTMPSISPEIILQEPQAFFGVELPARSRVNLASFTRTIDGEKEISIGHLVAWTSSGFTISGRRFPAGTSVKLVSAAEIYVYEPPAMNEERL